MLHNNIDFRPIWHSQEIYDLKELWQSELSLLSIHNQVINFYIPDIKEILAITSPCLYRGPFAIGLEQKAFNSIKTLIEHNKLTRTTFQDNHLHLHFRDHTIINTELDKTRSTPFSINSLIYNELSNDNCTSNMPNSLNRLTKFLLSNNHGDSITVLNNDNFNYFQKQIGTYFPIFVNKMFHNEFDHKFMNSRNQLVGLGRGSTPTGDDMIHGSLLGVHVINCLTKNKIKIPSISTVDDNQTTKLSYHMLRIGEYGVTPEPVLSIIHSLVNDKSVSQRQLGNLRNIGSHTGLDIITGLIATLQWGYSFNIL